MRSLDANWPEVELRQWLTNRRSTGAQQAQGDHRPGWKAAGSRWSRTQVAELCELDDQFRTRRLARYLVATDNRIEIIGLAPGGAELARAMLEDALVDPFGRTVTQADGADFLKTLRWARSSDFLWVTACRRRRRCGGRSGNRPAEQRRTGCAGDRALPAPRPGWLGSGWPRCDAAPDDYTAPRWSHDWWPTPTARSAWRVRTRTRWPHRAGVGRVGQSVAGRAGRCHLAPAEVFAAGFDEPGDRAWRDALVGTGNMPRPPGGRRRRAPGPGVRHRLPESGSPVALSPARCSGWRSTPGGSTARSGIRSTVRPLDDLPDTSSAWQVRSSTVPRFEWRPRRRWAPDERRCSPPDRRSRSTGGALRDLDRRSRCDLVAYFAQPGPPRISQHQFDEPSSTNGARAGPGRDGSTWAGCGTDADPPVVPTRVDLTRGWITGEWVRTEEGGQG